MPMSLKFSDKEDEKAKCDQFLEQLVKFYKRMGNENFEAPSIGGKDVNLCKLYKAVYVRGGSVGVNTLK